MQVYAGGFDVRIKDDNSPVTAADLAANQVIEQGLQQLTPELPVLSEESAQVPWEQRRHWGAYWLVDPLDGTREARPPSAWYWPRSPASSGMPCVASWPTGARACTTPCCARVRRPPRRCGSPPAARTAHRRPRRCWPAWAASRPLPRARR
ncbi:hypothetical protein G6F68_015109 [Rhizopus microsporus]|nr:hypothetical protein G6F68_015109 [Rhizopus microsporus]